MPEHVENALVSSGFVVSHRNARKNPTGGKMRWCERRDSNPHALRRQNLNLVRLPIPPLSRAAPF
jgi:hypothetical protein